MEDSRNETIKGIVDEISFRREENGFTVLVLDCSGEPVTVVGSMPDVYGGSELSVCGQWQTHPSFGKQFRADSYEQKIPSGAAAILRYLSGGAIKGIGPSTASKIVELFGDETLYVMENEPKRLAMVKGISLDKAQQICSQMKEQFSMGELIAFLSRYQVSAAEALSVWRHWGTATRDMVEANPYVLCLPELGIGFERIDAAAARLERPADDFGRIAAGILHILQHNTGNGHSCIPRVKLIPAACYLLGQNEELINEMLEDLIDNGELYADELAGREFIFLSEMYQSEAYCAGRVLTLTMYPPSPVTGFKEQIELNERILGIKYDEKQREAIEAAMEKGFLVLTGGPGTGKTTTLNAIIGIFESCGQSLSIAAPTGRAAKRITEVTGHEAKTIHRLLEVEWDAFDRQIFKRNETSPLECDVLIIDELSMTDIQLFEALLRAVKQKCRLVLVGDSDQLPSVGPGNVLADLISSKRVPVVQLTEVFRQAERSAIVLNAHKIIKGEMPVLNLKDNDFFFMERSDPSQTAATIEELYSVRLPNAYGFSPLSDIQVLCPSKKGIAGTKELNKRLQQRLNPPSRERREVKILGVVFREGDKVMQIKNNYDVPWVLPSGEEGSGIFNGDIGIIVRIDIVSGHINVRFDERLASYMLDEAEQLEHAYAVTVHKSQGSEFTAVIIPVCPAAPQLLYRSLLYTAVTRAKKLLILIGQRDVIEAMVKSERNTRRYTALSRFIIEQGG